MEISTLLVSLLWLIFECLHKRIATCGAYYFFVDTVTNINTNLLMKDSWHRHSHTKELHPLTISWRSQQNSSPLVLCRSKRGFWEIGSFSSFTRYSFKISRLRSQRNFHGVKWGHNESRQY